MDQFLLFVCFLMFSNTHVTSLVTNLIANDTAGYFTSVNYPNNYYDSSADYWFITTNTSSDVIIIKFYDSRIEGSLHCAYDYVEVFDGPSVSSPLLGKFCDTSEPCFVSSSNTVTIFFSSDSSVSERGFKAKFWSSQKTNSEDVCDKDEGHSVGTIIGIIIGTIVLAVIALVVIVAIAKGNAKKRIRIHGSRTIAAVRPPMPPPYSFVNPVANVPSAYQQHVATAQTSNNSGKFAAARTPAAFGHQSGYHDYQGGVSDITPPAVYPDGQPPPYESITPPPANYSSPPPQYYG